MQPNSSSQFFHGYPDLHDYRGYQADSSPWLPTGIIVASTLIAIFLSTVVIMVGVCGCGAFQPFYELLVQKSYNQMREPQESEAPESIIDELRDGEINGGAQPKDERKRKKSSLSRSDDKWLEKKMENQMFPLVVHNLNKAIEEISKKSSRTVNPVLSMYYKVQEARRNKLEITRIGLTGGACSGKTTVMGRIPEKIKRLSDDYCIMTASEAASIIFQGGGNLNMSEFSLDQQVVFQTELMKLQIALENTMLNIAINATKNNEKPRKILLFCDRGLMDGEAYISPEGWKKVLANMQLTPRDCKELRYDLIIHTLTAADGAEGSLNFDNEARSHEQKDFMLKIDENLRNIYNSHPQYYYVNNQTENLPEMVSSFEFKMRKVDHIIFKYLGLPCPLDSLVKKYYMKGCVDQDLIDFLGIETKPLLIVDQGIYHRLDEKKNPKTDFIRTQSLLQDEYSLTITKEDLYAIEDMVSRERRSYFYKMVTLDDRKHPSVKRRLIDRTEYFMILDHKETKLNDVYRLRRTFFLKKQLYWIDTFLNYLDPSKDPNKLRNSNKNKHELFSVLTVQTSHQFPGDKIIPSNFKNYILEEITDPSEMYFETLATECYQTDVKTVLKTLKSRNIATMKEVPFC